MIIYAEGTPARGAGHLIRCRALAQALGATLATRTQPDSLQGWAWAGMTTRVLEADSCDAALAQLVGQEVIVDQPQATAVADSVVIEDVPSRSLSGVRLVVNPWAEPADYPQLPTCTGPAYTLLRPEFASALPQLRDQRTLVLLGATDHRGLTPKIAADLRAAGREPVVPGSVPWTAAEVAQLMRTCRDGVLSCSGVACEAAACGLPFVAVRTAPDQVRLAQLLVEAGVPVCDAMDPAVATTAPAVCVGWDGLGAARVAARIREAWISSSLRPAVWSDAGQLLAWANDPQTRAASFHLEPITLAAHQGWLRMILRDPERRLLLDAGGTVRLARCGEEAVVSVTVAPDQRGRGEGRRLLAALADWARAAGFCRRLVAWVRHDNPASLRLFAAAGYHAVVSGAMAGHPATRFHLELT